MMDLSPGPGVLGRAVAVGHVLGAAAGLRETDGLRDVIGGDLGSARPGLACWVAHSVSPSWFVAPHGRDPVSVAGRPGV